MLGLALAGAASLHAGEFANNGDFADANLAGISGGGGSFSSLLDRFGVGAQVGTNGIGGHLTFDITNWLYLKGEVGGFSYDGIDFDSEGAEYEGDLDLFAAGITVNVLPFEYFDVPVMRGFRLSAGAYRIDHSLDVRTTGAEAGGDFETDLNGFNPDGALTGSAEFSDFAPYVGIGWDWRMGSEDQFVISLDVGVIFVGSAEVDLDNNSGNPALDVDEFEDDIEDETDKFEIYPLVQLGVGYRF